MAIATFILLVIVLSLAAALRSGDRTGLITRRPFNNRYSDAAGARDRAR
jgi:hypothetical protein